MKKRLVFVSYAVNGKGLGHVVRQLAIQKWVQRLCAFSGVATEHWFLTTSEADTVVFREGFASFKLPSKTIIDDTGLDKPSYLAMARLWVHNAIALLRPDVLLVDTFAQGSFHELGLVLDLVPHKVLVQRPVKAEFARHTSHHSAAAAYDLVIVPEHEDDVPDVREALGVPASRLRFVGPVVRPDVDGGYDRTTARARLGVGTAPHCVLVTGGGGGDDTVEALFDAVHAAVGHLDDVHVVYAVGPLYRGTPRHGHRRTHFCDHDLAEHAAAFDVAVSAAGFNTIHELLVCGVPTVVVPQDKIADDQLARASRYADRGAFVVQTIDTVGAVLLALLHDPPARAAMSLAAKTALPRGHAREAAAAVLAALIPPSVLRTAVHVVDDALVKHVKQSGETLASVVALTHEVLGHEDRAAITRADIHTALSLVHSTRAPAATLARVFELLRRRFRCDDPVELVAVVGSLCTSGVIDGQFASLVELLSLLPAERPVPVAVVAAEVVEALTVASARGVGVAEVAGAFRVSRSSPAAVQQAGSVALARLRAAAREAR